MLSLALAVACVVVLAEPAAAAVQCPAEADSEMAAVAAALTCRGEVKVASATTERQEVFARADGTLKARLSAGVERVADGAGGWNDVDLRLQRRDDGTVASAVHPAGLVLAGASQEGALPSGVNDLAMLSAGGERFGFGWRGGLPQPTVEDYRATYPDVQPGVDVVIDVTRYGFEQSTVVRDRASASALAQVRLPLETGSLTPRLAEDGRVELLDATGDVAAEVGAPRMWDAVIDSRSGDPANVARVGVALAQAGEGRWELVLTPDAGFLMDPATVYPVTIDPSFTSNIYGGYHDTWLQSCCGNGWHDTELRIGIYDSTASHLARSWMLWTGTNATYGHAITSATMYLWEVWAYSCAPNTAEWGAAVTDYVDNTTTWSTQPGVAAWNTVTSWETRGNENCGSSDGWVSLDVKSFFQKLADDAYPYWMMQLRAMTEYTGSPSSPDWNEWSWKKFSSADASGSHDPYVEITYDLHPNAPSAVATNPTAACVTGSSRPHLSVIPQLQALATDPEGSSIYGEFEYGPVGGLMVTGTSASAASGSWLTFTPPAASLPDGGDYQWRARAHDAYKPGDWSSWCEFHVDPQAPTNLDSDPGTGCVATSGASDTASLPRLNTNTAGLTLKATVNDINGGNVQTEFEWWPKATKGVSGQVGGAITLAGAAGSTFQQTVASGVFASGTAYSWRVRGKDGGFTKPWSPWCEFVADYTPPGAPTVTADPGNDLALAVAPNAPAAPGATAVQGRPTQVTLHPAGGTDPYVVGYWYGVSGSAQPPGTWVAADASGVAVVSIEPVVGGFSTNRLTVVAVDSAGNQSAVPLDGYSYGFRANPAAGLWRTTGSSGPIADVSGAGNDLTLSGGASLGSGSLTLDGSSGEAGAPGYVLETGDSFTVSAWVKPSSLGGDRVVASQDGDSESAFTLGYSSTANAWCFSTSDVDSPSPMIVAACAGSPPTLGQWAHLTGVYDANTGEISLYVNGTLVDTQSATTWYSYGLFTLGRGLAGVSPAGYFAGAVADVRAWPQVLDAAGIAAVAALPHP